MDIVAYLLAAGLLALCFVVWQLVEAVDTLKKRLRRVEPSGDINMNETLVDLTYWCDIESNRKSKMLRPNS